MSPDNNTKKYRSFDIYLLLATLLLVFIGLVMVFSSSAVSAQERFGDSYYFLKRQAISAFLGLGLLVIAKKIPYRFYWKFVYPLLFIALGLLVLVLFIGHGGTSEGVRRWIRIGGFSMQPTEFAKICVIIFVAYALSKKQEKIRDLLKGFLPVLIISGVYMVLILKQRDLGSVVTLGLIIILMLFISGTRVAYLLGIALLSLPVLYHLVFSSGYRSKRIFSWLDPWSYPEKEGWHLIQSYTAFKAGGLTGVGLGDGKQKLFYLPEAHTDFILPVLGEELGMIGVIFVLALFTFFIFRGIMITLKAKDLFGLYLAFGLTCLIGVQAMINVAVVMGVFPTKGLTLPFISYGGTSLLVSMTAVGILLNISSDSEEEYL